MDNDLGTPSAVATVFEQVRAGHSAIDSGGADTAAQALASVLELAGVLGLEPPAEESDDELDRLVGARQAAREARDFAAADRIRDDLHDRGIEVEDTPSGPIWRRIR
jgi:cysteinyl-tRNA synthetase